MESQKVLITGATGKIGNLLAAELLRHNFKVRILVRKGSSSRLSHLLSSDVGIFKGDIRDFTTVSRAMEGVSLVFHLAALLHINLPEPSRVQFMEQEYYDINVLGTWNIFKAALHHGVKRVVFFSTVAVYGPGKNGETFFEESPLNPGTPYAATKALGEKLAMDINNILASKGSSPLVTVLRPASVYGAGVTGNYLRLIKALRRGFFIIPRGSKTPLGAVRTLVHERDVLRGAILAATHPEASGKTYNLTDGTTHTLQDIALSIAGALGKKVVLIKVPSRCFCFLARSLGRKIALIKVPSRFFYFPAGVLGKKVILFKVCSSFFYFLAGALHALDKLMERCAVDGSKIERELGFTPEYDLKRGWGVALGNGDILGE
ncbi:MAG: NAD-dependent epimerase/dehydratase family protein [Desulfamplus sp.]|nr:NAD-dependent epimerase/dehydratase family protein [Desulfamplus sp.]